MSVKKKLLEQIEKKASKIRQKRIDAASNKNLESYVFEFFRNVDSNNAIVASSEDAYRLTADAHFSLYWKLKTLDSNMRLRNVIISWTSDYKVQGVTIEWSPLYMQLNNSESQTYVDIGQMILSDLFKD